MHISRAKCECKGIQKSRSVYPLTGNTNLTTLTTNQNAEIIDEKTHLNNKASI